MGAIAAQYVPCTLSLLPISMPNSHLWYLWYLWSLRPTPPTWEEVKYMSVHAWVSMVCLYRCDAVGVKQTAMNPWRASSEKPFITTKKEEEERRKEEGRKERDELVKLARDTQYTHVLWPFFVLHPSLSPPLSHRPSLRLFLTFHLSVSVSVSLSSFPTWDSIGRRSSIVTPISRYPL